MSFPFKILVTKNISASQLQAFPPDLFQVQTRSFIQTVPVTFHLSEHYTNLIVSSQNAVKHVESQLPGFFENKKVFCVGEQTAAKLVRLGAQVALKADSADQLTQKLLSIPRQEKYLFLSGNLRNDDLPNTLIQSGIRLDEVTVYETQTVSKALKTDFDGILFFSPSGVRSFTEANHIGSAVCFSIGNTTTEELKKHTLNIQTATRPSVENVVNLCIDFFKKKKP